MTEPLGLLGGTFDPIHWGHIRTAAALRDELSLPEIRFLVSARPPHRPLPQASAVQRLAMVELALRDQPGLVADRRELDRPGPSYTLWTLRQLRAEMGQRPLLWIVGADALTELPTWFQWSGLLGLSHWVVLPRPGSTTEVPAALAEQVVSDPQQLHSRPAGLIYIAATPKIMISASEIRADLQQGTLNEQAIPGSVLAYIEKHGLYRDRQPERGRHAV